ncbi:MAG: hypothetical protein J0H68_01835 [Sphingobacteriia bacterium]|nr:hypothetical protein [Sphingobacteriia bacterium]
MVTPQITPDAHLNQLNDGLLIISNQFQEINSEIEKLTNPKQAQRAEITQSQISNVIQKGYIALNSNIIPATEGLLKLMKGKERLEAEKQLKEIKDIVKKMKAIENRRNGNGLWAIAHLFTSLIIKIQVFINNIYINNRLKSEANKNKTHDIQKELVIEFLKKNEFSDEEIEKYLSFYKKILQNNSLNDEEKREFKKLKNKSDTFSITNFIKDKIVEQNSSKAEVKLLKELNDKVESFEDKELEFIYHFMKNVHRYEESKERYQAQLMDYEREMLAYKTRDNFKYNVLAIKLNGLEKDKNKKVPKHLIEKFEQTFGTKYNKSDLFSKSIENYQNIISTSITHLEEIKETLLPLTKYNEGKLQTKEMKANLQELNVLHKELDKQIKIARKLKIEFDKILQEGQKKILSADLSR